MRIEPIYPMVEQKLEEVGLLLGQAIVTAIGGSNTKVNTQMAKQNAEQIMKNAYKEEGQKLPQIFSVRLRR